MKMLQKLNVLTAEAPFPPLTGCYKAGSPYAEVSGGKAPASHLSFTSHGAIAMSPQGSWPIKLALIKINL